MMVDKGLISGVFLRSHFTVTVSSQAESNSLHCLSRYIVKRDEHLNCLLND